MSIPRNKDWKVGGSMSIPRCKDLKVGTRVVRIGKSNIPTAEVGDIGTITGECWAAITGTDVVIVPMWGKLVLCKFDSGKEGPCFSGLFILLSDLVL